MKNNFYCMIHKDTFDVFIEGINTEKIQLFENGCLFFEESINEALYPNGIDCCLYPNIAGHIKTKIRNNFSLHIDEEIIYIRDTSFWNNRTQGLVITDCGITCVDNNTIDKILWIEVKYVEYKEEFFYFFFSDNRKDYIKIQDCNIFKNRGKEARKRIGLLLSNIFIHMADTQKQKDYDEIYEKYNKQYVNLIEQGKEYEALQVALDYRKEEKRADFSPRIAWYYHNKGDNFKAMQVLNEDIGRLDEDNLVWKSFLTYHKYSIYVQNKDFINARKSCLYVKRNAPNDLVIDNVNIQEKASEDFNEYEKFYIQHFLEQPYIERKLIVPVKSYSDLSQKKLAVVDINHLPTLNFPIGHPVANQLYVGHPYIPSKYIPFESYELELIEDKIREFCQIMQFLGATEINIESVNASSNNSDIRIGQKISGGINYKLVSASGSSERERNNKFLEDISQHINLHQRFLPKNSPILPEKLVWYQNEPSWQRLYSQRMQGALIEHEERIETKKSQVVENSELKQISAEVKWLFIEANGNWEQSMEGKFEAHENAILSIHVKFAPLESLGRPSIPHAIYTSAVEDIAKEVISITNNEKEYLEELKACLEEDYEVSNKERRLLNRLRERLGISAQRAEELEASLIVTQLAENEQEYLDEYKACMEEGEISPHEKRLIDKLRVKLGISENRARKIESRINLN